MKKTILSISIILLLLVPVILYSQDPPPPSTQEKIKNKTDGTKNDIKTKTDAKPSQNRSSIIINKGISTRKKTTPHHCNTNSTHSSIGAKSKEGLSITNFFNLLLVVFTFVIAFFNIKLWRTAKKSADAAKEAADATKKSVDIIPTIERAYVYVYPVSADFESWRNTKPNQRSPISITVRNYGRTPAKLTQLITKIKIGISDGIRISWGTPDDDEIIDAVGRFIASNSENEFFYYVHNTIGDGNYHIIFSGEVRYRDIFEKDHIAYFKWSLVSSFERGFYINDPDENYTK